MVNNPLKTSQKLRMPTTITRFKRSESSLKKKSPGGNLSRPIQHLKTGAVGTLTKRNSSIKRDDLCG
jgi:hypothetical protein